jgi:hypothetical protein
MHVVGHHLNGLHLYLRVMAMDAQPFALHGFAQFRQFDSRFVKAASLSKGIANKVTEDGATPLHFQRDHIHTPFRVVMMGITALHRSLFRSGKFQSFYLLLFCHGRYAFFSSPLVEPSPPPL